MRTQMKTTIAALSISLLAGCMPANQGELMRREAEARDRRIEALENGLRAEQERFRQQVSQAETKVAELESVLERATAVVTRNSADLGQDVISLKEQIGQVEGQLAELRNMMSQIQRQIGEQGVALEQTQEAQRSGEVHLSAGEIPAGADPLYALAVRTYEAEQFTRARAFFRSFVEKYPSDARVDNALYFMGASYRRENKPARALGELQKVVREHARGDAVGPTLYEMGEAFFEMRACEDAKRAFDALIKRKDHPALKREARLRVQDMQRNRRTRCD